MPPSPTLPKLQPPGAGLPWLELFIVRRFAFPMAARKLDWPAAARLFQHEGKNVLILWGNCPPERLAAPILIPRLTGIEDSSRHWSVAMTVEHLNIVGFGILELIAGLRDGRAPERAPRIQDVKPRGEQTPAEVHAEFTRLLSEADDAAMQPPVAPGEGALAPHPWFGPMDAHRWHCLMGVHQRIHRRQVAAILEVMEKSGA